MVCGPFSRMRFYKRFANLLATLPDHVEPHITMSRWATNERELLLSLTAVSPCTRSWQLCTPSILSPLLVSPPSTKEVIPRGFPRDPALEAPPQVAGRAAGRCPGRPCPSASRHICGGGG